MATYISFETLLTSIIYTLLLITCHIYSQKSLQLKCYIFNPKILAPSLRNLVAHLCLVM